MAVTKQVYFSSTFFKSLVDISDNIPRVVRGTQYNYKEYRHKDFPLHNNYLDDFIFKHLLRKKLTKSLL